MDTHSTPTAPRTSAPGFVAGRPPEWDIEIFKAGDEVETALVTLERNRRTFAWKCWGVAADGLQLRLGRSAVTLGGLLKHLALCEEQKFQVGLAGAALLPEFRGLDHGATWETWAWESAADDEPEALRDLWQRAVHRSRDTVAGALAASGLDAVDGNGMSLRRLISDLIEEYARHTGHADLLREAVDGATGEDPPGEFPVP
ncbi:mycothiol transferase [Microlunatus parietis]|uniref:DinB superfamily protein n=1 Tax=Microlunatus parietis TaxID=682979 RepID=A0A7Y9LCP7_9ACTN|nr:DUF664 domain-containing protein [Microlunatus parietis]NYE71146.1 hypothetical protein [Microlunatus parietis]